MNTKLIFFLAGLLLISFGNLWGQCVNCDPSSNASGNFSSALGHSNTSSGYASFTAGANSSAIGATSISLGLFNINTAEAYYSTTIGSYCKAMANEAIVIGHGANENNYLTNRHSYSLMMGFNSYKSTFFISTSPEEDKTGRIAIGDIPDFCTAQDVRAKFHIRSDEDEDAIMFIEPFSWEEKSWAEIKIGDKDHSVKASYDNGLEFNTAKNFIFNDGKVGIGIIEPKQKLDVNGNIILSGQQASLLFADDNSKGEWGEWGIEYQYGGLNFWKPDGSNNFGNNFLFLADSGNVGIGTKTPLAKLHIKSGINEVAVMFIEPNEWKENACAEIKIGDNEHTVKATYNNGLEFNTAKNFIFNNGSIGIGTTNINDYKLAVAGKIHAQEIKIEHPDQWSDFVFDDDYDLRSISDLETFINENNHLPEIPSAEEVNENGVNVGEMEAKLLKKVEELTLYLIEQQKVIDKQQKDISILKEKIK